MSYKQIDDSGEFNDSVVYLHPVRFTQKSGGPLARHNNPEQVHLGIYESIKLSPFLKNKQGKVIELVSLDHNSSKTFVNEEGEELLRQYPTNEIAFVMVVGNQNVGKSFFCDKILNLSEIRGNHFCRSRNTGINIWSSPFEKGDLKIFLLEISGCSMDSESFKILLTYSIMIGSAFVIIDDLKQHQTNALDQFDIVLSDIIDRITPSKLERKEAIPQNRNIFLPEFFYFLKRKADKQNQNLSVVVNYIEQKLPNALVSTFQGDESELMHLPFLDVKCISEEYIRKTSHIFTQLYEVITEKKYNDLTLTGSIILKVIKYIENYINNSRSINIQELYERVIEDLYQSAYNYCILSYHEEMEKHFEDEQPKSLDDLLFIFETASSNVLQKFQEFTLDEKFHHIYQERLEKHINEKEIMILDINKLKTQRVIHSSFDGSDITDYDSYKRVVKGIVDDRPNLNHGQTDGLGRVVVELWGKVKNVDYKALKQIERLNEVIEQQSAVLAELKDKNEKKSKERSLINKQNEELYQNEKRLEGKKKQIRNQIEKANTANFSQPDEIIREREHYEQLIKKNKATIYELKQRQPKKHKDIILVESKIEQTTRNINRLQKVLLEMKSNGEHLEESPKKDANKQKIKK